MLHSVFLGGFTVYWATQEITWYCAVHWMKLLWFKRWKNKQFWLCLASVGPALRPHLPNGIHGPSSLQLTFSSSDAPFNLSKTEFQHTHPPALISKFIPYSFYQYQSFWKEHLSMLSSSLTLQHVPGSHFCQPRDSVELSRSENLINLGFSFDNNFIVA